MSRRRINRHRNKLKPRITKAEQRARRWPDLCYEFKPAIGPLWQEAAWLLADAEAYHMEDEWEDMHDACNCCCCTGECQSDWLSEWNMWWITQSA